MPLNDSIGSTAADVLERDAQDFDRFVVGTANTFVNRLGVTRLTISGIIADASTRIDDAIVVAITGGLYVPVGDFGTEFTISERREVGFDGSVYWRWNGALPHTVLATDTPSSPAWTDVTQATLAADLINPTQSANRVARMPITADSLVDLLDAPFINGRTYQNNGFYPDTVIGGGSWKAVANADLTQNNGGTFVSKAALQAWYDAAVSAGGVNTTNLQANLDVLFAAGTGAGDAFVRIHSIPMQSQEIRPEWFGSINDPSSGMEDTAPLQKAIDTAYSLRKSENAGNGLYVQESSIPVVYARNKPYLVSNIKIPPESLIDITGSSIDATGSSGFVFSPSDVNAGIWRFKLFGGVVKHAESVFDFVNANQAAGKIEANGTVFDDISVEVAKIEAQSTNVEFNGCSFFFIKKLATILKCDFCLFENCFLRPSDNTLSVDEQTIIENYGNLVIKRMLANPSVISGTPINCAWISNKYDSNLVSGGGSSGMVTIKDCRWGGEVGSLTVVNNYASAQTGSVKTKVDICGGSAYSANGVRESSSGTRLCIIRLFEMPNMLSVEKVSGVLNANLIDKATTTEISTNNLMRINTNLCDGANAGASSFTGTFIPPELIKISNKDAKTFNITSNINVNHTICRGGRVTNFGTSNGTNIFTVAPPAREGMEITYSNTESGSGFIQIQTSDVIDGGIYTGSVYYQRVNYGESITFFCEEDGIWQVKGDFTLKGDTSSRPYVSENKVGFLYIDTSLDPDGKPIWWNGASWVDATGTVV